MGSALSICITPDTEIHRDKSEFSEDGQFDLPPLSSLYVPFKERHKFVYDTCDSVDNSLFSESPRREYSLQNQLLGHGFINHLASTKRAGTLFPRDNSRPLEPHPLIEPAYESDQESVMTAISPCKDRVINPVKYVHRKRFTYLPHPNLHCYYSLFLQLSLASIRVNCLLSCSFNYLHFDQCPPQH